MYVQGVTYSNTNKTI